MAFVGAGNVATHLALAFAKAECKITSVYSRTIESAEALGEKLNRVGQTPIITNELAAMAEADVYIVSVKDEAIPSVVASWPGSLRNSVVLHTAGSVGMNALSGISAHYGVLYPMQTFSKDNPMDFKQITCFYEGSDMIAEEAAATLASTIFGQWQKLSSEDRKCLHLAAVFACNFANHMYALAYEVLESHGIDPHCMLPLISETAEKTKKMDPHDGQTGPARRHDYAIIQQHIDSLSEMPELQKIYELLSHSITSRY